MQGYMQRVNKKRAVTPKYVSPKQLSLAGFETPFERTLNPKNRWVVLAHLIPWDEVCSRSQKQPYSLNRSPGTKSARYHWLSHYQALMQSR